MTLLADRSADAGSNVVNGDGSNSLTFTMPANVVLDVQSVVATVDNTAGGDSRATIVIRDASGQVIAAKRQGDPIPAGDTGTATWALRLTDEAAAAAAGVTEIDSSGGTIDVTNPTGPIVDIDVDPSVLDGVIRYNVFNDGGPGAFLSIVVDGSVTIDQTDGTADSNLEFDGQLFVTSDKSIEIQTGAHGGSWDLRVTASGSLVLTSAGGTFTFDSGGDITADALPVGKSFTVKNHLGNPIFRVNENGDLQGLTGKALAFNL